MLSVGFPCPRLFIGMADNSLKDVVKEFGAFVTKKLSITKPYKIHLLRNRGELKTYADYNPNTGDIRVYVVNRSTADVLRSIGHELVHHQQLQNGKLPPPGTPIPDIGGEIEDEANSVAGQMIKEFGQLKPELKIYG